jgi:integrase
MSDRTPKLPKYRLYRPKNLGVVRIDGRDHYLGAYDSPESRERYRRLLAEWLTTGHAKPSKVKESPAPKQGLTVGELIVAYWRHAEQYYRGRDGRPTQELENMRDALRPLRELYAHTSADEFGPLALRSLRQEMIRSGLARTTVNARVNRIRRVFRWAVSFELISESVTEKLRTVEGLQRGRSEATDPTEVAPAPIQHVEAALAFMPKPVAAMVRLQLFTGCRTGEVLVMRGSDLTPGVPNWEFRPSSHKNAWRGRQRMIPLGPKATAVVREFLKADLDAYLFSPRDTVGELHSRRSGERKTKRTPSEKARRCQGTPGQGHGRSYDRRTYRQAIVRACRRAGVPDWSPLQLRHTAATMIRAKYGLEAAQVVLGHAKADTTEIYAERDFAKAHAIATEIG